MISALGEPLLLWLFVAELVSFVILAHQGVINFLLSRGSGQTELRTYAIWCLWSAVLAGCCVLMYANLSERGYELTLHAVTISGVFMMRYYMASIQAYLGATSAWLSRLIKLQPVAAVWPIASALQVLLGGDGFFLQMREAPTSSLLLQRMGELVPRNEIVPEFYLIALLVLTADMGVLIVAALRAPRRDPWVMLGIVVTCLAVGYEVTAMRAGWRYAVPVFFAANLIEVLRITYVSTLMSGRELASLEREVEHQHQMIAAQIRALAAVENARSPAREIDELGHELRNPVASAMMYLYTAERDAAAGRPIDELLGKLRIALSQLSHVIARVAPGSDGPAESVSEPIGDAVDRAAMLCNVRVEEAAARLEISVPDNLWVHGPPAAVTQVFVNLIANACDAVAGMADRAISIDAARAADHLSVRVCDPGPCPTRLEALAMFQPRFTLKSNDRGSGLGLRISREVVEQLGGTLEIDLSSPTMCFVVSLPLAAAEASSAASPSGR